MIYDFNNLISWYHDHARDLPWRKTKDAYSIWISEVMLQQTRVEAVKGYYARFLSALPTVRDLAAVEEESLLKLWEGLGYYSRARNLKKAAIAVCEQYGSAMPADYDALLSLPGIGEYTAGAVASIAYDIPVPAVDGNVLRVFSRLDNDARNILDPSVKKELREKLLPIMPKDHPGIFNQAVMELGATVCLPNGQPQCALCPMANSCLARAAGTEQRLPTRITKKQRRVEEKTVFLLTTPEGILGYRREDAGLLAGLWQLPDEPGFVSPEKASAFLSRHGLFPRGEFLVYHRKHVFTHVEWHMQVYAVMTESPAELPKGWAILNETLHPLPTAYKKCL